MFTFKRSKFLRKFKKLCYWIILLFIQLQNFYLNNLHQLEKRMFPPWYYELKYINFGLVTNF